MAKQKTLDQLRAEKERAETQLAQAQRERSSADDFVSTVLRFSPMQKLRPNVLHQLIDHIEVHQAQRVNGV